MVKRKDLKGNVKESVKLISLVFNLKKVSDFQGYLIRGVITGFNGGVFIVDVSLYRRHHAGKIGVRCDVIEEQKEADI